MIDLSSIRARLDAATPGPWEADAGNGISTAYPFKKGLRLQFADVDLGHIADADFIANAPTDISNLLCEVERLLEIEAIYKGLCK